MNDELNNAAYVDVLDRKEPTMPQNEEYMRHYERWRALLPFNDPLNADLEP